ncbi:cytochrome P450 [Crocosphaera chwakensis]|uniref:Cytochrome P450 n=1 Tax=Crocosphaera chwakensis CCY0110 TaxID=391612 RepID=A3IH63_9CHRO|nr:cytochrome P450 [Crocosphaera chwakensis]EAZ94305.1 cytochrome P450 [Crocosphaera chwakensis CCY0110]
MVLPPSISTPRLLRLFKLIFYPLDSLENYYERYGDIFIVGQSETPFVYISNPQGIQEILTKDKTHFRTGGGSGFLTTFLGNNSLLSLKGEKHQRERKLLTPAFHGERLQSYATLIYSISDEVSEKLEINQSFNVREIMQEITLQVILKAVFGIAEGKRYQKLKNLLTSWLSFFDSPINATIIFFPFLQKDWGNWTTWGRFLRIKAQIDDLIYTEINERRQQKNYQGKDILTLLILARDEDGNPMSDQELHDELITLLIAGHETTASSLTWALYWIHYCPEVEEKLRSHFSILDKNIDLLNIIKLPYLDAVCSETLRIYPVVVNAFIRVLETPLELMGYQFKPGTVFAPAIYLVHHREDIYPNSKQFRPERFLERQFSPYEYLPFGGGSRRCIGMELAKMEMKIVLFTLLSKYKFKLSSSHPLKPVRRGLTIAPPNSFKMIITQKLAYT